MEVEERGHGLFSEMSSYSRLLKREDPGFWISSITSFYNRLLKREDSGFQYISVWMPKGTQEEVCFFTWLAA